MENLVKLIWDFRGETAEGIAKHHVIHLNEFLENENYKIKDTGYEVIHENYSLAYMKVLEEDILLFRDALRPHRATK
jgi:hypothetical protein